jgi:preprotein translocase subunit SecE
MASEDDKKTGTPDAAADSDGDGATDEVLSRAESQALVSTAGESSDDSFESSSLDEGDEEEAPAQFGYKRFVYAAYFAGAILVGFVAEKTLTFAWLSLAKWKPNFGEPSDEVVMPVAAVIGVLVALYYWKRTRTRELAEDVASELAKVTWPTKKEVANNTMVVIFTTTFATVFFTLMDRFWSFVTNWVYGT